MFLPNLLGFLYLFHVLAYAQETGPPGPAGPPGPKGPSDREEPIKIQPVDETKCDPRSYVQRGYCQKYFTCNRKTRKEIKRGCSDGLFWNPNVNSIHGGVCDYYRNIENQTLFEYKKDNRCVLDVAYFRAEGECSPKYFYNHPIRTEGKEVLSNCPQGLLWAKEKESCEVCSLAFKADGSPCCNSKDDDDY